MSAYAGISQGLFSIYDLNSGMCLDVTGASDKSGTNIQLYTNNDTDAQLWAAIDTDNGWMFFCSLTDNAMAYQGTAQNGTNVLQLAPNASSTKQYWDVVESPDVYAKDSNVYQGYWIRPHGIDDLYLGVQNDSTQIGANVQLTTSHSSMISSWIFIPRYALTDRGCYEIIPQWDKNLRLAITGKSIANGAKAVLETASDENHQKFILEVKSAERLTNYLIAAHSQKALDMEFINPKTHSPLPDNVSGYVQQWTKSTSSSQSWLIEQYGTTTWSGELLPVCEVKLEGFNGFVLDVESNKNGSKARIWPDSNSNTQRWVIRKNEQLVNSLTSPGRLNQTSIQLNGYGSTTYSNPTFKGKVGASYQARYRILRYNTARTATAGDSSEKWHNTGNDSTTRDGWGDAWTPTFTNESGTTTVTLPFSKAVSLNANYPYIQIIFEVREYVDAYTFSGVDNNNSSYSYTSQAHGPSVQTIVSVAVIPTVTLTSIGIKLNDDWGVYIEARFNITSSASITRFRVRLLDSDGVAISSWGTNDQPVMNFGAGIFNGIQGSQLRRLPDDNEPIKIEYSLSNRDDVTISGILNTTFHYATGTLTVEPQLTYLNDDTYCVTVSAQEQAGNRCYMEVPDVDGIRLVGQSVLHVVNNTVTWKCAPPLNRKARILVINSSDSTSGGSKNITGIGYVDVTIEAHVSIWNWSDNKYSEPYDMCAAIMVNAEKPPQQTRTFSPRITKYYLSGRQLPVAFAGNVVENDLSITGVILPEGTKIYSQRQLNPYAEPQDLSKLSTLARKDIYPLYRSPYGDWGIVVIESVEMKRDETMYFTVTVKQAAIGD